MLNNLNLRTILPGQGNPAFKAETKNSDSDLNTGLTLVRMLVDGESDIISKMQEFQVYEKDINFHKGQQNGLGLLCKQVERNPKSVAGKKVSRLGRLLKEVISSE